MMYVLALPGPQELIWIVVIVVILFGAKKLPELARSMGSSVTQFKKGLKDGGQDAPPAGGDGPPDELPGGNDDGKTVGGKTP